VRLTMNVPDGWTAAGPSVFPNPGEARLDSLIADHPAEWACDASWRAIKPRVGPTVDDLVTFLAHQPMLKITADTDVTLDGYGGTYLEYTTSYDGNTDCQPPEWPFGYPFGESASFHQAWILDVDGVRLVIDASTPKASDAAKAEFQQIVDSIAFEPTGLAVQPTPAPTPAPTPTPIPTPLPTPYPPTAGPVPHGARPWTITVVNRSSKDAPLFLVRHDANGVVQLCGSVTPDVVPAKTTEKVTFQLPPRKSDGDCQLGVRPLGDLAGSNWYTGDVPEKGHLLIQDGGDNANGDDLSTVWVGP
jgi:hypothetical protein